MNLDEIESNPNERMENEKSLDSALLLTPTAGFYRYIKLSLLYYFLCRIRNIQQVTI